MSSWGIVSIILDAVGEEKRGALFNFFCLISSFCSEQNDRVWMENYGEGGAYGR